MELIAVNPGETLIKINPNYPAVEVTQVTEIGLSQKDISRDKLLELLKHSSYEIKVETEYIDIPTTGPYFLKGRMDVKNEGFTTYHLVPASKRSFTYFDDSFEIPYPNLLFKFKVVNNRLVNTQVFAVKSTDITFVAGRNIIKDQASLCYFPFPNVSSNACVCWGSNSHDDIEDFFSIYYVIEKFFQCPYNCDYFRKDEVNFPIGNLESQSHEVEFFLEDLQKRDFFPDDYLVANYKKY